jgi:hypothetical protein
VRIGIEPDFAQIAPLPAALEKPALEARDLALAEAGYAVHAAREAPVQRLGLRRDQSRDAELLGDRLDNEPIRRRDHHRLTTGELVLADELASGLRNARPDKVQQELAPPFEQALHRLARQRLELELQECVDVERAAVVLDVVRARPRSIHGVVPGEQITPFDVAVPVEKRVVEIEEGQSHDATPR